MIAAGLRVGHLGGGDPVRDDLGVHVQLAHPAGDQLGVLGAEVDDEHRLATGYEGPSLVRLDNGGWRIYVDRYSTGAGIFTATSSDLNSWTGLSAVGCSGCRHGTAIAK